MEPKNKKPQFSGILTKQGGIIKNWKQRFFVADELSASLSYYEDISKKKLKGKILLKKNTRIEKTPENPSKKGLFNFSVGPTGSNNRTFFLAAASEEKRGEWMKVIQGIIKDLSTRGTVRESELRFLEEQTKNQVHKTMQEAVEDILNIDPKEVKAATIIQALGRTFLMRKKFQAKVEKTVLLQSFLRGFEARKSAKKQIQATICIQSFARGFLATKQSKQVSKRMVGRKNLIVEIISTEKTYVTQLELVEKIFFQETNALSQEAVMGIFSNWAFIAKVHRDFLNDLEARSKEWLDFNFHMAIGDVILKHLPNFSVVTQFVNNFDNSLNRLKKVATEHASLLASISKRSGGLDLADLLITPVQRIPRYELMFADLFNNTQVGEPDYDNLKKCLEDVKSLNHQINLKKKESDSLQKIQALDSKLVGKKPKLMATGRIFIKEGHLRLIAKYSINTSKERKKELNRAPSGRKQTPSERFLKKGESFFWILFNDTLLWSEPKEKRKNFLVSTLKFEALKEIPVWGLSVAEELQPQDFEFLSVLDELNAPICFRLENNRAGNIYIIRCESVLEKNAWVKALRDAIHENHSNKN